MGQGEWVGCPDTGFVSRPDVGACFYLPIYLSMSRTAETRWAREGGWARESVWGARVRRGGAHPRVQGDAEHVRARLLEMVCEALVRVRVGVRVRVKGEGQG